MSPLLFVVAAFAVMKAQDWAEELMPSSWVQALQPWMKSTTVYVFTVAPVYLLLHLHQGGTATVTAFGISGLASLLHQAHKALGAVADDKRQQVFLRAHARLR